jgi:hypothetical protein
MARIKSPDMPGFIKPQLATLRAKAPAGDQWLHEIKFDMVQATASSTGRHKFRPDIVVRSGPPSNNTFITDPVVVVEVLSPSTMDRDRGRKQQFSFRRCCTSCWPMPTRCGSSTISGPRMDGSSVAAEVKGADIF